MKRLLVAIDGSECSLRAVDFVGRQFAALDGLRVTLLHILPGVPAELWDDGHILPPRGERRPPEGARQVAGQPRRRRQAAV